MVLLILEHITTNSFGMLRDSDFDGIFDIWSIAPEHWPSQKDGPSSNHWFSRTMLPSFSEGVSEGIHKFTPLVRDPFAFGAVSFLRTHQAARQDPWFFSSLLKSSRVYYLLLSRLRENHTTKQNLNHLTMWSHQPMTMTTSCSKNKGAKPRPWPPAFSPRIHILGSDRRTVLETWPICHGWWFSRSLGLGWHDQFVSIS